MDLASKLFKGDRVIWVIFMFLCLVSVIEVFSATSTIAYKNANHWAPIVRHATFLLGGFVLVLLMHNIPCRFYSLLSLLLPVSMVLLAITPFVGVVVNGEPRWLEILGIRFQPSEIAKIAAIGYTAFILSKRNWFTDKQMFWYILGGVGGVCFLIFFNNGSTAILLFAVTFMMMFIGQISIGRLLRLGGAGIIGVLMLVGFIRFAPDKVIDLMPDRVHTWKARIERFSDPADAVKFEPGRAVSIDGDDYQVVHAKIALARGGLFGKFPGHGQQRDFLPQAYSDFIYAIIIEEMGIVGGVFVLLLYIILLVRVGMIARRCDKLFPKFLVLGCGLLVVVQALTNMAVAGDLIPVTGQPLPLVSRGGTSTVISCAYIGIILSVSRFGANMGNEEEIPEEEGTAAIAEGGTLPESERIADAILDTVSDKPFEATAKAPVGEENPLEAVRTIEETTTETKI